MLNTYCSLLLMLTGLAQAPESLPDFPWTLTTRPWTALETPREAYLDAVEDLVRYAAEHINESGAFIDPILGHEHQYATPYFAAAAGMLLEAGRAPEVASVALRAMDHATGAVAAGHEKIPDGHGEFFLAPLSEALECYTEWAPPETCARWRKRLQTPIETVIAGLDERTNNWRTYAMKGAWARAQAGLVDKGVARNFVEDAWLRRTQRERMIGDRWGMYQDWSSDPQSMAVEAVGRGNLIGLLMAHYDGPSQAEMLALVKRATAATLLFQDPTGQAPPNGRTDNHVFNDVLYLACFEALASLEAAAGNPHAGVYRRAARLAFQSIQRWKHTRGEMAGAFQVTKNFFDPEERIGYQPASQISNYNGAIMYHLAEAWRIAEKPIAESPAPCEQGGYVLSADPEFGCAVANAGGMQIFVNLRGDSIPKYNCYWTPLGVARIARAGWDSRLGPLDGLYEARERTGITFAPTWKSGRKWQRLSEEARHYRGVLVEDFTHPLLVRCHILYYSATGIGGPAFRHEFILTPHCILSTLTSPNPAEFGLTLPVLAEDGTPLETHQEENLVRTAYAPDTDEQVFFCPDAGARLETDGEVLRGGGGGLQAWRVTAPGEALHVGVYPRTPDQPSAAAFAEAFERTKSGFTSLLGRVDGRYYQDAFAAGGEGDQIDLNEDGIAEARFSASCCFLAHHAEGHLTAIESDRDLTVEIAGAKYPLTAHTPLRLP